MESHIGGFYDSTRGCEPRKWIKTDVKVTDHTVTRSMVESATADSVE